MKSLRRHMNKAWVFVISIAMVAGLVACDSQVAATVNGTPIPESTITARVMSIRDSNASYEDDTMWAYTLMSSSLNPHTIRQQVIDSEVQNIIIRQLANEQELTPNEETINASIEQAKTMVGGDDTTWASALKKYGFLDEADYRSQLEIDDLHQQLTDNLEITPTDEELREFALTYASYFGGKRSSAIALMPNEEQTQEDIDALAADIKQQLTDGADFATLVTEYSLTTSEEAVEEHVHEEGEEDSGPDYYPFADGNVGWSSDRYIDPNYQTTLDGLAVGDISDPFVGENGVTYIIMCTEEYAPPEEGEIVYEEVPADIIELLEQQWVYMNQSTKMEELLTTTIEEAEVLVNPMPEDVPYNVDMTLIGGTNANDFSAAEEEAVQAAFDAGLVITDATVGEGDEATPGCTVAVHYVGSYEDGTVFDSNEEGDEPYSFVLGAGGNVDGFEAGIVGMKVGGTRTLVIPPEIGYGDQQNGDIPPNTTLYFEITLVEVTPVELL